MPPATPGCRTTRRTFRAMGEVCADVADPYIYLVPTSHAGRMPGGGAETTLYAMATRLATRVLIVDDHLAVREGLRSLIDPDPDFDVIGEAGNGNEAAEKALELQPDLILLDNSMPGLTGLEVARILRTNLPAAKIVFLTLDPGIRDLALATGAVAHVSKDQSPQEIVRVIRPAAGLAPKRANELPTSARSPLAELFIAERLLTVPQLEHIERGRDPKQLLSGAVLQAGIVPEDRLASALARFSNRKLVSLANPVSPAVAKQLPRRFCELRACLLIELSRPTATLAVADPLDETIVAGAREMLPGVT